MVKVKKPTKKVSVTSGKKVVKEVEMEVADNPEIQDGIMPTNARLKEKPPEGTATVGLALGATINVGDFQSARIDVFIQRNVKDNEQVIRDELLNISELLHTEIERQSEILLDDE